MSRERVLQLRRRNAQLHADMQRLTTDAGDRALNADELQRWDAMDGEYEENRQTFERLERQLDRQDQLDAAEDRRSGSEGADGERSQADADAENELFLAWVRGGLHDLTAEQRQRVMERRQALPPEARAMSTTGAEGGYTIPEGFSNRLSETKAAVGGLRRARVTIVNTAGGETIPWPTEDDTSNTGELLAEGTAADDTGADPTWGVRNLAAYMYSSKIVRVSVQLLQDSAFDLESHLARKLGIRLGKISVAHMTTGTGTGQPDGVVTRSAEGKVGTTGQTTSVIYDDLVDLEHAVDPDYRTAPEWMFHDTTLKALKKLSVGSSDNRPLWLPGIAMRQPDTILGHPYVVNQAMPVMAANAKSILFGDFSEYVVRDVRVVQLVRFGEKYMNQLQVGFLAFQRMDGDLMQTGAVKHYKNSAT